MIPEELLELLFELLAEHHELHALCSTAAVELQTLRVRHIRLVLT